MEHRTQNDQLPSSRVFISYHRADAEGAAGRLSDNLRHRFGDDAVFLDVAGIELGTNWERAVDYAMADSIAILLVAGPSWILTDSIAYEVRAALRNGVPVIPVLVKGADWVSLTADLPANLKELSKFNAARFDHRDWHVHLDGLITLLDRMFKDPARARIILMPPEPQQVLGTSLNKESLRQLLLHAADLAECLDDPAVLEDITQLAEKGRNPGDLIEPLGNARYRLMIEEIGRSLVDSTDFVARYLGDEDLESEIRYCAQWFEEEKTEVSSTRGDSGDPGSAYRALEEVTARAKHQLWEQLPGITRTTESRDRLIQLVEQEVNEIVSRGYIQDRWGYVILKHFTSYPDMPMNVRNTSKARALLEAYNCKLGT